MFASLGASASKLIHPKDKPGKKVVVLVSRRNGVEKIKYCQTGKRPIVTSTDNQFTDRNQVQEWLEKSVGHVQRIEKQLSIKKKKLLKSTSKDTYNVAEIKEFNSNNAQNENDNFQSSTEKLPNHSEICMKSEPFTESLSQEEVELNKLQNEFKEEINKYKEMIAQLQNDNIKLATLQKHNHSENPVEESAMKLSEIDKIDLNCRPLKDETQEIKMTCNLKEDNSEIFELISELNNLSLDSTIKSTENENQETTVSGLKEELKKERAKNQRNLKVIEILIHKFALKTEDFEKILLQENFRTCTTETANRVLAN